MSIFHRHPISLPVAIGSGLLALWVAGGLMTALVAAALADLSLSVVEWRRRSPSASADVQREQG